MGINFEKYFNESNIEIVERKVDKYIIDLYGQKLFLKNIDKQDELYNQLILLNNPKLIDLFFKYDYLNYVENSYTNWLAYHLGKQDGFRLKNKN